MAGQPTEVIANANVQEFFRESVGEALANQKVQASEDTVFYVVNLLTEFTTAEGLFERTPDGLELKPLALVLGQALHASNPTDRTRALRRLGDVALYVAGFFSNSLSRKLIDIDYYISMGGNAYSSLPDVMRGSMTAAAFSEVFRELAVKFPNFVDVLGEVSEKSQVSSDQGILRLYEVWMRTGSKRIEGKLQKLGITPTENVISAFEH